MLGASQILIFIGFLQGSTLFGIENVIARGLLGDANGRGRKWIALMSE